MAPKTEQYDPALQRAQLDKFDTARDLDMQAQALMHQSTQLSRIVGRLALPELQMPAGLRLEIVTTHPEHPLIIEEFDLKVADEGGTGWRRIFDRVEREIQGARRDSRGEFFLGNALYLDKIQTHVFVMGASRRVRVTHTDKTRIRVTDAK